MAIAKTVVMSEAVAHLVMVMKAKKAKDLDVEDAVAVVPVDITKVVKERRPSKMEATVVATANVVNRLKIVRMMAESTPEAKHSVKDVVVQEALAPEMMMEESVEEAITTVAAKVKMANVALTTTIVVVKAKTDNVVATITAENVAPTIIVVAKAKKVNAEAAVVAVDVVVVAVVAAMVRVAEVAMVRVAVVAMAKPIKTITLAKANERFSHLSPQGMLELNKLPSQQSVINQISSS